jgi:hypothetical protein
MLPQNTNLAYPYPAQIFLAMALGPKKAVILNWMASLVATGAKRAAEKFSPQKDKRQKKDFEWELDKENLNVSATASQVILKQY